MSSKYLNLSIDYFQDEDGAFIAVVPAIKGCVSSGITLEEAYKNITTAIDSCLEARETIHSQIISDKKYIGINTYRAPYKTAHV